MKFIYGCVVLLALVAAGVGRAATPPADITGTWVFSVDLDTGDHGDPTFVFKQEGDTLTGTYDGPLGPHKVTGVVKDNKAVFGFEFEREGATRKVTYTGVLESATKMTGTMEITPNGPKGKWTATRNQ